jgi:hypothetical protein
MSGTGQRDAAYARIVDIARGPQGRFEKHARTIHRRDE